jgi:hypothetical protein
MTVRVAAAVPLADPRCRVLRREKRCDGWIYPVLARSRRGPRGYGASESHNCSTIWATLPAFGEREHPRQRNVLAIRTTYIVLMCGAGILAGVGGWLIGDQLFFQSASASLTRDDPKTESKIESKTESENDLDFEARYPVSNTMMKQDRVIASPVPVQSTETTVPNDMYETARAWIAAPVTSPRRATARSEKPSRLFLNDSQIAGIKKRLNLTPAQQKYWPPVENAMREVTLQIEDYQKRLKKSRDDSFDTESDAIKRLKTATRALYGQLTGTQKNDIALLVRMAGLGPAFAELTGTKAAKNEPENSR